VDWSATNFVEIKEQ